MHTHTHTTQGMLSDLSQAPAGSVVVLHACAHNPTGVDPSSAQWRGVLQAVQERQLLPFFDCAYQVRVCVCVCLGVCGLVSRKEGVPQRGGGGGCTQRGLRDPAHAHAHAHASMLRACLGSPRGHPPPSRAPLDGLQPLQGFASGDVDQDAAALRLFAHAGQELLLAQVRVCDTLCVCVTVCVCDCVCVTVCVCSNHGAVFVPLVLPWPALPRCDDPASTIRPAHPPTHPPTHTTNTHTCVCAPARHTHTHTHTHTHAHARAHRSPLPRTWGCMGSVWAR
jgi:hypothetical protein